MNTIQVVVGDATKLSYPDNYFDLVVTSPPYYRLRDYQDNGGSISGQTGGEASVAQYLDTLLTATKEAVRVLRPEGSIWVNLGDSYIARGLLGVPWRYALRAIDELGLTLRAEVIWEKTNAYVDAKATGRVRRTHETWFHFAPTSRPYADDTSVAETPTVDYTGRPQYQRAEELFHRAGLTPAHRAAVRSVGIADSEGGRIRSGGRFTSSAGLLAAEVKTALGSYYRELCGTPNRPRMPGSVRRIAAYPLKVPKHLGLTGHYAAFPLEWPTWIISGWCPPNGRVLDPFGGTGTTALAARASGRSAVSVDLSSEYTTLAKWRVADPGELARAQRLLD